MQPLVSAMILAGPPSSRCRGNDRYHSLMTGSSRPSDAGAGSEQRLAASGGTARASAWWLGGRGGLERGLDGVGDELCGLRVDGDVPAEQHATDDLPGVPWPGPWHVHRTRSYSSSAPHPASRSSPPSRSLTSSWVSSASVHGPSSCRRQPLQAASPSRTRPGLAHATS